MTIRHRCLLLALILLSGVAVVQAGAAFDDPATVRQAVPGTVVTALAEAAAAFAVAIVLNWLMPRLGVWVAAALVAAAVYAAVAPAPAPARTHVWLGVTLLLLVSLAALNAVPAALVEAAAVDRASAWFAFRTITLPLVAPLLLLAIVFRAIDLLSAGERGLAAVVPHVSLIAAIIVGVALSRGRR
jgi:hypothetical protein